jgi:hypothetical protein
MGGEEEVLGRVYGSYLRDDQIDGIVGAEGFARA